MKKHSDPQAVVERCSGYKKFELINLRTRLALSVPNILGVSQYIGKRQIKK
jgi:hypothetical protein